MKPITINGEKFEYIIRYERLNHKSFVWTSFYQGTETESHKKYWLFGETITKEVPKFMFRMEDINIEDSDYTKEDIKREIMKALAKRNRRLEIQKGEIV